MPRLVAMTRENIPEDLIPKGWKRDSYVTNQKRLYIRENKKFVGFGFEVRLYDWKQRDSIKIIVKDDELIDYF